MKMVVVQIQFREPDNLESARELLFSGGVRAKEEGARVLVFPPYTGLLPLRIVAGRSWSFGNSLQSLLRLYGDQLAELLLGWARDVARRFGIYVVPGTLLEPGDNGLNHRAYLLGPDGAVLGCQGQTHLAEVEREWGLSPEMELGVFATPLGKMGIAIGTDVYFPEVSRILTLQGAEVIFYLTALPAPYEYWAQVAGAWQQVQQNQVFAAEACLVGAAGGRQFAGRSAIYGPCEITLGFTGTLKQAESPIKEELITAEYDLRRLHQIRTEYPLFAQLNPALYQRYFPQVYRLSGGGRS